MKSVVGLRRFSISLVVTLFIALSQAHADQVKLNNGDKLTGTILSDAVDTISFQSDFLGTVTISKSNIARIHSDSDREVLRVKKEADSGVKWTKKASAGYVVETGNTEQQDFNAELVAIRKSEENQYTFKGKASYGETESTLDEQKWALLNRFAHTIYEVDVEELNQDWVDFFRAERIEAVAKFDVDHDKLGDIDVRFIPTVGASYWFTDRERFKAKAELGIGATYTNFSSSKSSETEFSVLPSIYLEKTLFSKTVLSEEFFLYPSFSDAEEYRFTSETKLSTPITDELSLDFSYLLERDNTSGGTAERDDQKFITALSYTF